MKRLYLSITIITCFYLFGCASQQLQSTIPPGVDINKLSKFYTIHFKNDKRGLHETISNELNSMGFTSSYGEEENIPNDVDAIVRYVDNWQWDITNYMIKITITMRKPDESLLATATSFRTSLVRKDHHEMIRETLNEIFHQ
jgi:hypothetical protein